MLTALGKFLRKLRIDRGEVLKDMADKLEVSSAFLSSVENGKKKMPEAWKCKIPEIYDLSTQQREEFFDAAEEQQTRVELDLTTVTKPQRDLALSFAREFPKIDNETLTKILKILEQKKGE